MDMLYNIDVIIPIIKTKIVGLLLFLLTQLITTTYNSLRKCNYCKFCLDFQAVQDFSSAASIETECIRARRKVTWRAGVPSTRHIATSAGPADSTSVSSRQWTKTVSTMYITLSRMSIQCQIPHKLILNLF